MTWWVGAAGWWHAVNSPAGGRWECWFPHPEKESLWCHFVFDRQPRFSRRSKTEQGWPICIHHCLLNVKCCWQLRMSVVVCAWSHQKHWWTRKMHLFYRGVDTTSKDRHNNIHCDNSLAHADEQYRSQECKGIAKVDGTSYSKQMNWPAIHHVKKKQKFCRCALCLPPAVWFMYHSMTWYLKLHFTLALIVLMLNLSFVSPVFHLLNNR